MDLLRDWLQAYDQNTDRHVDSKGHDAVTKGNKGFAIINWSKGHS
jgi:hypothetical protein